MSNAWQRRQDSQRRQKSTNLPSQSLRRHAIQRQRLPTIPSSRSLLRRTLLPMIAAESLRRQANQRHRLSSIHASRSSLGRPLLPDNCGEVSSSPPIVSCEACGRVRASLGCCLDSWALALVLKPKLIQTMIIAKMKTTIAMVYCGHVGIDVRDTTRKT